MSPMTAATVGTFLATPVAVRFVVRGIQILCPAVAFGEEYAQAIEAMAGERDDNETRLGSEAGGFTAFPLAHAIVWLAVYPRCCYFAGRITDGAMQIWRRFARQTDSGIGPLNQSASNIEKEAMA